jgi:HD-GYP domain-containing protein (c-di-GMP phosphodiesterase class II)
MNGTNGLQEYVLVSREVEGWVDLPEKTEVPIRIDDDLIEEIITLVRDNPVIQLNLILIVHARDINRLDSQLQELRSKRILYLFIGLSEDEYASTIVFDDNRVISFRTTKIRNREYRFLIKRGFSQLKDAIFRQVEDDGYSLRLMDAWNDQEALINIGKALSLEKDPDRLLRTILYFAKKITGADAGSIFIVEETEGQKLLRFKYSHTFSKDLAYEEFTMLLDTNSIAGYAAVTGSVLNIPDVYELDENDPVSFNRSFDEKHGYRTKSMLVLPMRNHIDEVIGVIQLINSKEVGESYNGNEAFEVLLESPEDFKTKVGPFKKRYEGLMEAVAGQAATAMENNRMLIQIEQQFQEFVKASVTAIESRDPATSGHSFRVAEMCVNMAHIINDSDDGAYRDVEYTSFQIKELEFAALLHDFGKVYINPAIFLKEKKLFPKDYEYLMMRLKFLYRCIELTYSSNPHASETVRQDKEQKLAELRKIMELVTQLNEPRIQDLDPSEKIQSIMELNDELSCQDLDGNRIPLLERQEIVNLNITKGSLNPEERKIIESHVEHTYTFVSKIPWPEEYKNIPEISRKHHEKLDGTGYPLGLRGKESIPEGARIMAIADIFDALSATDRPYKKSISQEQIFGILKKEAETGQLDSDLVELFIEYGAWKIGEMKTEKQEQIIQQH